MPSTSSLTSHEKALVKKYAPTAHKDKIHAAAIGRVYYAYPDPAKWSYSGIAGAVTFGWGANGGWIKVVDLAGTRGVIWQHAVLADMPYYQDRTFFHTFPSDVSLSLPLERAHRATDHLLGTSRDPAQLGLHDRDRLFLRVGSRRALQKSLDAQQVRSQVFPRRRRRRFGHPSARLSVVPLALAEQVGRLDGPQQQAKERRPDRQEPDRSPDRLLARRPHGL
jgi:hypothetical protein